MHKYTKISMNEKLIFKNRLHLVGMDQIPFHWVNIAVNPMKSSQVLILPKVAKYLKISLYTHTHKSTEGKVKDLKIMTGEEESIDSIWNIFYIY